MRWGGRETARLLRLAIIVGSDVDAQVSDSPRGMYLETEEIHGGVFEVSSSPIPRVHPQSKHVITSDVISEFAISRLSAAL